MSEEKKIIIDEDWKSQVEAEKEALKHEAESKQQAKPAADESDVGDPPMPPASFDLLLSTLATEAMVALGVISHPATGKSQLRPNQAKYLIDTIGLLKEKTKGNLTPSESQAVGTWARSSHSTSSVVLPNPAGAETSKSVQPGCSPSSKRSISRGRGTHSGRRAGL